MPSKFTKGFEKTAFIGAVASGVGRLITRIGGGKVNTALTALQAGTDMKAGVKKMEEAGAR